MILAIDASNIRSGGGLTHLRQILINGSSDKYGFSKVIVWSSLNTLSKLPELPWLEKRTHSLLNKSFFFSFFFQFFLLSKELKKVNCDLLFVPGGTFIGSFKPIVSLSQNMLPFEKTEIIRFSSYKMRLKFNFLRFTQGATFKKSEGTIFLTAYAMKYISNVIKIEKSTSLVPHGIDNKFLNAPKKQENINSYSSFSPFKLLYVSIVTDYKHQWNVAEAVLKLRNEGYPITLDLVGSSTLDALKKLNTVLENDKDKAILYKGMIPYEDLPEIYKSADAFVFASSCENMPIILIEAMSAGLPIVSSEMGPMPEVLGDAGFYFNPLDVSSIYNALREMLESKSLREEKSNLSYQKSLNYTWKECSDRTFEYLFSIANTQEKYVKK